MKDDNTLIITEVAQAYDGSLGIAHAFIDAVSKTSADIIKFQTHIAQYEKKIYTYHCQDCKHSWTEKQSEIAKNVPRYQPCPKCKSSNNIVIKDNV